MHVFATCESTHQQNTFTHPTKIQLKNRLSIVKILSRPLTAPANARSIVRDARGTGVGRRYAPPDVTEEEVQRYLCDQGLAVTAELFSLAPVTFCGSHTGTLLASGPGFCRRTGAHSFGFKTHRQ